MPPERRKWSQKEDDILKIAVGEDVERIDWLSVAQFLPGRNNKECRKRWYQKFDSNTNHGSWSEAEDERLRAAINQHGTKWTLVARDVATRNSEQCSKRWNDVLNPDLNRSPWTADEDQLLLSSVDAIGRNWKLISELHFPDRAALSLKNRHALLLRRQARRSLSRDTKRRTLSTGNLQDTYGPNNLTDDESEDSSSQYGGQSSALQTGMNTPGSVAFSLVPFGQAPYNTEYMAAGHDIFQGPGGAQPDFVRAGSTDISTYNDMSMDTMTKAIDDAAAAQQFPQLQQPSHSDISLWQPPQPSSNVPISTPVSTSPSSKAEAWEEIICLGIRCPRKELESLKLALLEAATKVPCGHDGGDEKIQIKLTVRKEAAS
ncbi:hypothetical protein PVAR5_7025 [Paecilomyces variotii No. 5]|uniref:Uncharacterized protein n=1 Tax=Byssochlamys spectabilis (strain No. 5 / NBRC 109023) TaxID=1356009 RepID=V5G1S3_BYSSN|nr:hypothetical protein PVAR5_7025 [Paecilomyces variotii No. 5]